MVLAWSLDGWGVTCEEIVERIRGRRRERGQGGEWEEGGGGGARGGGVREMKTEEERRMERLDSSEELSVESKSTVTVSSEEGEWE